MWTPEHRCAADRRGLRYPSDLSNAEWALVEPLIPSLIDQNPCAHWHNPMDMMRQG